MSSVRVRQDVREDQDSEPMRGVWLAVLAVAPFWVAILGVVIR